MPQTCNSSPVPLHTRQHAPTAIGSRGSATLDLTNYRDRWNATAHATIPLERPLAAYRLVATDAAKFIEDTRQQRDAGQTYTVTVIYGFYFPLGCNAITGQPDARR